MKRIFIRTSALFIFVALLGGCTVIVDRSGTHWFLDPGGKRTETWEIQDTIDRNVAAEARHERPNAGCKSWHEYWAWSVWLWRKYPNSERWVSYMKMRRHLAGLPELHDLNFTPSPAAANVSRALPPR